MFIGLLIIFNRTNLKVWLMSLQRHITTHIVWNNYNSLHQICVQFVPNLICVIWIERRFRLPITVLCLFFSCEIFKNVYTIWNFQFLFEKSWCSNMSIRQWKTLLVGLNGDYRDFGRLVGNSCSCSKNVFFFSIKFYGQ